MTLKMNCVQETQYTAELDSRSAWLKIDTILKKWVDDRQKVWTLYAEVARNQRAIQVFCQILVDYIATGHFEVFEKLALAKEICTPEDPSLDIGLLENISKTTLKALDFNDKYSQNDYHLSLAQDLSWLGEHLANRIEWEDQLLTAYFKQSAALR